MTTGVADSLATMLHCGPSLILELSHRHHGHRRRTGIDTLGLHILFVCQSTIRSTSGLLP